MVRIFLCVSLCLCSCVSYGQRPGYRPDVRPTFPPIRAWTFPRESIDGLGEIVVGSQFYNRKLNNNETETTLSNLQKTNLLNYDTTGIPLGRLNASPTFNIGALISSNHILVSTHVSTPASTVYCFRNRFGEFIKCRVDPAKPRVVIKNCVGQNTDMSIVRLIDPAYGCTPLKVVDVKRLQGSGLPGSSWPYNFVGSTYNKNGLVLDGDGDIIRLTFLQNFFRCVGVNEGIVGFPQTSAEYAMHYTYAFDQPPPNKSGSPIVIAANGELLVFAAIHSVNDIFALCLAETTNFNIRQISDVLSADNKVLRVGTIH